MPIHINAGQAATLLAERQIPNHVERREEVIHIKKAHILADWFNGSTVLLAVAAVAAIFFAHSTAVVFGTVGLVIHHITKKEIRLEARGRDAWKARWELSLCGYPLWINKPPLPNWAQQHRHNNSIFSNFFRNGG